MKDMYSALPNLNPVAGTMKIHAANFEVVDGEVKISMKDRSSTINLDLSN